MINVILESVVGEGVGGGRVVRLVSQLGLSGIECWQKYLGGKYRVGVGVSNGESMQACVECE